MDAERVRAIIKKLPHVEETVQWGEALVFWVGDKAIGGKMFAVARMEPIGKGVLSFSAGPEGFAELLENDGVIPAPYMARIHWVALEHWNALDARELSARLAQAHALTYAKLPRRTQEALQLPAAGLHKLIEERRDKLAAQKAAKSGVKQPARQASSKQGKTPAKSALRKGAST